MLPNFFRLEKLEYAQVTKTTLRARGFFRRDTEYAQSPYSSGFAQARRSAGGINARDKFFQHGIKPWTFHLAGCGGGMSSSAELQKKLTKIGFA